MSLERRPAATPAGRPPALSSAALSSVALSSGALAGAVGIGLVVIGLSPAVIVALVVLGWLAGTAVARQRRQRRPREERIDPFVVGEPWRLDLRTALQAQGRYRLAMADTRPGPLRDRLLDIGRRLDDGVAASWRLARRGDNLDRALASLDRPRVRDQLAAAESGDGDSAATGSLRAQLEAADRIAATAEHARHRLRDLTGRLDEAAARAVELSVRIDDVGLLDRLDADVTGVVDEMEALRQALTETAPPEGAT